MTPSEIACRNCAAQPGEMCFDLWNPVTSLKNYRKGFHVERIFDAGTWDASPVDKKLIEKAAEDLV